MKTVAHLIIAADGFECVKLEQVAADQWAARCHGTVHALVLRAEAEAAITEAVRLALEGKPCSPE